MKRTSWILPVLMLLIAAENLYWDTCYGHLPKAAYCVMGLMLLLGLVFGFRLRKTGKPRFLVLLIVTFVLYLLAAIFRDHIQAFCHELLHPLWEDMDKGCWTEPLQMDWE